MVRLFSEEPTEVNRAVQAWVILIGKAANRQTATYNELGRLMGLAGGSMRVPAIIEHISNYCDRNALPPLGVLAVSQQDGRPGQGPDYTGLEVVREEVFRHDWFAMFPPAPNDSEKEAILE